MFADNADLKVFTSLLPDARFAPVIPGWEEIADATTTAVQKVYLGEAEAGPAFKEAAEKINGILRGEPGGVRRSETPGRFTGARATANACARPKIKSARIAIHSPGSPPEAGWGTCFRSFFPRQELILMNLRASHPYLLILPSFLLAAFIILWPLVELSLIASHDVNRFGQLRDFSGLVNFAALAGDTDFLATIARTLIWTVSVVGGTLIVSLPVALILNDDFYGRGIARVIVMLPWAVSLTMTAVVWRWALNGEIGMLNAASSASALSMRTSSGWRRPTTAFPMQILIGILVSVPFNVTIFLGGLSSVPATSMRRRRSRARRRWQQFTNITFPLLRPFINIALVLNTIYVFNSFPIIWVMTQGGPANSTDIMVTYLYKLAFRWGKLGEAAAVSMLMFSVLLAFT